MVGSRTQNSTQNQATVGCPDAARLVWSTPRSISVVRDANFLLGASEKWPGKLEGSQKFFALRRGSMEELSIVDGDAGVDPRWLENVWKMLLCYILLPFKVSLVCCTVHMPAFIFAITLV